MDESRIAPFLKYSAADIQSYMPSLSISFNPLNSWGTFLKDGSYGIVVTIHRAHDDGHDQPCIFYWSGYREFSESDGFILLHHTTDGQLKKVDIAKYEGLRHETPTEPEITKWDQTIHQFPPGHQDRYYQMVPKRYLDALIPGEKYELVWSGGEVCWWAWGTIRQHEGQTRDSKPPLLILPGGPSVSFTAVTENPPIVRQPSPPPIQASERVPGTPALSVTLEGPEQKRLGENIDISFTVTYHGIVNGQGEISDETRPITLSNKEFPPVSFLERLYRLDENGQWETSEIDTPSGGMWIDEEVCIKLEDAGGFSTLQPGSSWTDICYMDFLFPEDEGIGDVYMYRYKGATVSWWDWGNREEHANTVITLPSCYSNGRIDPPGNPLKLVLPASNDLNITIVE